MSGVPASRIPMRAHLIDRPSITLPLCVLGAGVVHGLCIAALLPMLITVPVPITSDASDGDPQSAVVVDIIASQTAETKATVSPQAASEPPVLVTGSIAAAGALKANAIAKLTPVVLRQAKPAAVLLVSVGETPETELALTGADPVSSDAAPASIAEIETDQSAEPLGSVGAETEIQAPVALADPEIRPETLMEQRRAAVPQTGPAVRRARKAVAPPPKPRATQAKPKPRAPAKAASRPPARKAAASPARRTTTMTVRRIQAPRGGANLGLGLFFPKPQPKAVRR